jgi:phosphotriesterase-related protein
VLGIVNPETFGATLLHEHVLCDIRPPSLRDKEPVGRNIDLADYWPINYGEILAPGNFQLDEVDIASSEIALMMEDGGKAVVDLSCGGLQPDPHGLVEVSRGYQSY